MQRIIFLDIDGVLNNHEQSWRHVDDYDPQILAKHVKVFNRIVRETGANIVLSSTWRGLIIQGHMSLNGFRTLLRSHGVRGELIGHTPEDGHEYRWQEIAEWLKANPAPDRRYVIIDDDPDAFGGRPGVQTAGHVGLTDQDADDAIALLA